MITKVVNVNLHQPIYEKLTAKQGDIASRYLLFHLLDGDKPFDLTGKSVRVYARKPDKTEIFNDLIINDETKGYCTLELTSQCLTSAGIVKMELYISESGKVLTSIPFELEVIPCINTVDSIVSTNEFSVLNEALGSLQDFDNLKREIVDARKTYGSVGKRLDVFNSQLNTKTNRVETQRLQNQVNNLVLGAVGDGNNAEVVSSRGDFELLGNRLDDFDARTDCLVNIRNVFTDKCIKSKSWNVTNGDYNIDYGSSFSNAIIAQNGNTNISLFKDINVSKLTSGDYVLNLKCLNNDKDLNLFISIHVIGYPTSVSSGGTILYSYSDLRVYDITLKKGYQKNELKFKLNTSGYDHCRFIIELRTKEQTYNITDIYLGLENTECNDFSYIDSKLSNVVNEIDSVKNNVAKLKDKSLYLDGDSITFGAGYEGGYGKILSDKYGCINTNNAISGGTLASGTTYSNGAPRHYIAESVVNSVDKQYDYMILSGGFNDYGNNVPIGTLSDAEFSFTNPVTTDNVIGALETMFRHILQNFPTTKLYFLITHKANRCTTQLNSIGKTMQDYVNAIKSVCERYSIPVINVWEESRMITAYDNIATTYTNDADRVHPNQLGYNKFYLPVIEKELGL